MPQTPAQRAANAKFARTQASRRGKSESARALLPDNLSAPASDAEPAQPAAPGERSVRKRASAAAGAVGKKAERRSSSQKFVIGLVAVLIFGGFLFELLRLFFA